MYRIYSNGPSKDFVINPFNVLASESSKLYLAAPYFTVATPILDAVSTGKTVQLLVGLNSSTSPQELARMHEVPNLSVRYLTRRFHAKIFIFDNAALLGSSNLTDGGLYSNREAVICLNQADDFETIEEIRALFFELWDSGQVLTAEKLDKFTRAHAISKNKNFDPDADIEKSVGPAEPVNINVDSKKVSSQRIFLESLRQQVYEQYRPAFNEVTRLLEENNIRRPELKDAGLANETNRFLNWVRLTYVVGDEAWKSAPTRSEIDRKAKILSLAKEWGTTDQTKIPEEYLDWLKTVHEIFGSKESLAKASREKITNGLMSLHAFTEQLRFVKGGAENLPVEFWRSNQDNEKKVRDSLSYLVHGSGDFIRRLHDFLYMPSRKLSRFGRFCALELYGTIKPEECPPLNGRMAKALRYLGYDVQGA
jgi:hypothetical protein